jgi:serine/threonine protein kinase/predicted Zn-dependent protease
VEATQNRIKHFEIRKPIGKGGMGEVFLAQDTILDRKVAIKFLPQELQADVSFRERFFREAKAAAALDHPYICKIYETGEVEEKAYIVMEFIEGKDLKEQMDNEPLALKDILRVTSEIAEALEKAHGNGIVHRDLKPANIMLTPQGHVKIMDFGLAKKVISREDVARAEKKKRKPSEAPLPIPAEGEDMTQTIGMDPSESQVVTMAEPADIEKTLLDTSEIRDTSYTGSTDFSSVGLQSDLTQYGALVGTLAYMSPEQALGDDVDVRSDIFALGVMLYQMIAKKHPFLRKNPRKTIDAIVHEPPPPLKIKPKKLVSGLNPILRKALAKDVDQRYQSVKDFLADLQKMQRVLRIGSPLFYLSKPAMASLSAVLVVLTVGTFWLARRGRVSASMLDREPVSVLVADFQNMTGDSAFDGAVEQAVNIGLEGAAFISIFERPEAREIALDVYPDSGGRLDTQTAQLVSAREGIDKFISGSIEPRGTGFRLRVSVRDPVDIEDVRLYNKNFKAREDVLNAAAWMANKVRSSLGDASAAPNQAFQGETYTTSSLEAMNAYTKAQVLYGEGREEESIAEYLRAIEKDPDFGRAYVSLGMVYRNRGQYEEYKTRMQEALSRIDRMSEREKLRTRAVYALDTGNIQQALQACTEWVEKFPADAIGFSNLAMAHFSARDYERAKEMGQRAVELNPRKPQIRFNYSWFALAASDFESASQEAQVIIEENPDFHEAYVVMALSELAQGNVAESVRLYEKLNKINPVGESLAVLGLADVALYEGRLSDAIRILEEALARDRGQGPDYFVANKWVLLGEAFLLRGDTEQAIEAASEASAQGTNPGIRFMAAQIFIRAGETDRALSLAEDMNKRLEPEPRAYARLIEGELYRQEEQLPDAITKYLEAQVLLDTWIGRLLLGQAYLELEGYPDAHSALDSCLSKSGEAASVFSDDTPTYHIVAAIHYYLGRAQEGLGSAAAAESYRNYLTIKEKTDWDDPLITDARRRLEIR